MRNLTQIEFLDIEENTDYLESDLEKNIIEHLKETDQMTWCRK